MRLPCKEIVALALPTLRGGCSLRFGQTPAMRGFGVSEVAVVISVCQCPPMPPMELVSVCGCGQIPIRSGFGESEMAIPTSVYIVYGLPMEAPCWTEPPRQHKFLPWASSARHGFCAPCMCGVRCSWKHQLHIFIAERLILAGVMHELHELDAFLFPHTRLRTCGLSGHSVATPTRWLWWPLAPPLRCRSPNGPEAHPSAPPQARGARASALAR